MLRKSRQYSDGPLDLEPTTYFGDSAEFFTNKSECDHQVRAVGIIRKSWIKAKEEFEKGVTMSPSFGGKTSLMKTIRVLRAFICRNYGCSCSSPASSFRGLYCTIL